MKLCIHGHFYQPPREDPWFGRIFLEGSAAPQRHWNARITRQSYAPLAWARRLDAQGRIADLMNCYEWISFNVGPTLMLWLEREEPALLARIVEADRLSLARWGHGNAIAQVYHHVILPLASERDKEIEIEWALADFRKRFGRESEGLWLSECAADMATLDMAASKGIKFVVLSPHQARRVRMDDSVDYIDVDASSLDFGRPYSVELASGRKIAVFFYHAALAQSVAFEGLLSDGEKFWQNLRGVAESMPRTGDLLTLATDGETYGHHFVFGEMALAYVLAQGYAGRDGLELTNFGAYLAANPPSAAVELHEPSSWSCVHGVERWRSNCGCTNGGHPGWTQEWRSPLREALDYMKHEIDEFYDREGAGIFKDAKQALLKFGAVLSDQTAGRNFMQRHILPKASHPKGWMLLLMQESALSAYASCAWFFDDISRIEPVNALRYALLAADLLKFAGGPDILPRLEEILATAHSNNPEEGSGLDIFRRRVLPSQQDLGKMVLFSCLYAYTLGRLPDAGQEETIEFPHLVVRIGIDDHSDNGECQGKAMLGAPGSQVGLSYYWQGYLPTGPQCGMDFSQARISVWPDPEPREDGIGISAGRAGISHNREPISRAGDELAEYLHDYLALTLLSSKREAARDIALQASRRALATLHPFAEGQSSLNLIQAWSIFSEYLPLAVYICDYPQSVLEQLRQLLPQLLAGYPARQAARDLLEEAVLHDLATEHKTDHELAAAISRVNTVFPETDWWRVQNAIWAQGRVKTALSRTARELGFRV